MATAGTYSYVRNGSAGNGPCTVTSVAHGLNVGQQYQLFVSFSSVSVVSLRR